jgi:hypothetical protein
VPALTCPTRGPAGYDDTSVTTATFACVCPKNTYFQITTAGTATDPPVGECTACPSGAITLTSGAQAAGQCGKWLEWMYTSCSLAMPCMQFTSAQRYLRQAPALTLQLFERHLCVGCASGYWGNPTTTASALTPAAPTGCSICPTNSTRAGFTTVETNSCKCDKSFYWDATGICIRCGSRLKGRAQRLQPGTS